MAPEDIVSDGPAEGLVNKDLSSMWYHEMHLIYPLNILLTET